MKNLENPGKTGRVVSLIIIISWQVCLKLWKLGEFGEMHINSTTDFTSVQFDYLFDFRVDKLCSQGAVENATISTSPEIQLLLQEVPALCPLLSTSDPIAWKRWQGRSQGGVLGERDAPFCKPLNQTTYNRWRKWHDDILAIVTIWWVPSLCHSVTPPPLKNPGYAPGWYHFSLILAYLDGI